MTDYFDDFDDGEFMDDSFEDSFDENFEPEDLTDDSTEIEDEPAGDDICDDELTANEALMLGVAMGFAYEEGLMERRRRKLQRELDKDDDNKLFDD